MFPTRMFLRPPRSRACQGRRRRRSPISDPRPSAAYRLEDRTLLATAIGVNVAGGTGNSFAPPDTDGSIGPSNYVQFINGQFAVFNKATGANILAETDTAFWNNAGISTTLTNAGLSDTRVFYDVRSDRWFAVELTTPNTKNQVLVARSDTNNPASTWKAVNYQGDNGFADYPTLGVDGNAVLIGTNNFSARGAFTSVTMTTIPKADLLLSTPTVANRSTLRQTNVAMGFTLQGVTNPAASPAHSSVVAISDANLTQVNDTQVTGTGAAGATFGPTADINVETYSAPGASRQPDGTQQADGSDARITAMTYQVGDLIFTVRGLSVDSTGTAATASAATTDAARVTVIRDSTKALVTEATYFSPNFDYTYPSLAVNNYGDILMGFTRSGGSQGSGATNGDLGAYAVYGRIDLNNPTAGITFSGGDIQLKAGNANNYHLFGGSGERWGDFSATGLDPSNPTSFWTTQEFANSGGAGTNSSWGTQISQVYVSPQATGVGSTLADGTYGPGATVPITVSFDDAVVVTGSPTLLLNTTGGPSGVATYASGSGTNTLTFNYVVAPGQSSARLDYASTAALTLPGGASIKDQASSLDAILTLAAPGATGSLGASKDIVIVPTLQVSSFAPTSTGFNASFNVPFNLTPIHLYTTATANLGPADVTVVGASTGPVQGSLIVNPNDQAITFVKTGGVLAPDTYTVTFLSSANGFQTPSGSLLDGTDSGTPGTNFTTTFTVAPSSAPVVSIPDFARGPGQAVVIPAATGSGLPLTISDGTGVTSIGLSLTYNPALLTIAGANLGPDAPAGSSVNLDTSTPGVAVLSFTSPTALPAGQDNFVTLTASVPNAAPYASKEALVIGSISLDGGAIPAVDQDGVHVVAYLGDTTGNGGYSSFDATLVRQVVANISTGFAAYPLLDPRIVGDIAGFGTLSGIDATYITQYVANIPQPRIPALPGVTIVAGGPDPLIWLPQDVTASPGSTLSVPVLFRQTNGTTIGLDSANIAIEFDPSIFVVTGVRLGGVTQGFTLTESYDNATGAIIASLRSPSGAIELTPGTGGTLLVVDLAIRPGANLGAARLNLLGEGRVGSSVLYTSLNDGNLTLTPAPSDSDLDPVDGVVTVTAATTAQPVPVPSPAPASSLPAVAPAPALVSTVGAAGPPVVVDRAIEASHGAVIPANSAPEDSPPGELVPWSPSGPSVDVDAWADSLLDPPHQRAGVGKVIVGRATPDASGSRR